MLGLHEILSGKYFGLYKLSEIVQNLQAFDSP